MRWWRTPALFMLPPHYTSGLRTQNINFTVFVCICLWLWFKSFQNHILTCLDWHANFTNQATIGMRMRWFARKLPWNQGIVAILHSHLDHLVRWGVLYDSGASVLMFSCRVFLQKPERGSNLAPAIRCRRLCGCHWSCQTQLCSGLDWGGLVRIWNQLL